MEKLLNILFLQLLFKHSVMLIYQEFTGLGFLSCSHWIIFPFSSIVKRACKSAPSFPKTFHKRLLTRCSNPSSRHVSIIIEMVRFNDINGTVENTNRINIMHLKTNSNTIILGFIM